MIHSGDVQEGYSLLIGDRFGFPVVSNRICFCKQDTDSEEELKEAFKVFDKDQNGFISAAEVSLAFFIYFFLLGSSYVTFQHLLLFIS